MAAMMVGTTAFAESLAITDIDVVYTGLNTVEVSVPIQGDDQATILSVVNSQDLATVGDNANNKIVYINQDGKATGQANLRITGNDGVVVFPFCTERAGVTEEADGDSGKIDIYAAGSTYEVNAAALSIYKNAPAKSFVVDGVTSITLAHNETTSEAIAAKFADKKITVTHQLDGTNTVVNDNKVDGNDAALSYTLEDGTEAGTKVVRVTFDPAGQTNAKYGTVEGNNAALTLDIPATVAAAPATITGVALQAAGVSLPKEFTGAPTQADLEANGLKVKLVYTYSDNTTRTVDLATDEYTATVSGTESPFEVTIACTKADLGLPESVTGPAPITIQATVKTSDDATISGTVKSLPNPKNLNIKSSAVGAVVAVYDSTGATLQDIVLTQTNGTFSATVPGNGNYKLVISYLAVKTEGAKVTSVINNGATVKMVEVAGATADVGEILIVKPVGDLTGDGVANSMDTQQVNNGKGNDNYFGTN